MKKRTIQLNLKTLIAFISTSVIGATLLFFLAEGVSSTILIIQEIRNSAVVGERLHTEYDQDLGWINQPNILINDMYGPGIYLQTNSQRFRNISDFTSPVPEGKIRIICSGDSFTLGYGVNNDQAWCQQLVGLNPRIETVNMGQGGYGIDQAFLWYTRDGIRLDHQIHLFAFITADVRRMQEDTFIGYKKPLLTITGGELAVKNVPVPRSSVYQLWLARHGKTLETFKSVILLRKIFFHKTSVVPEIEQEQKTVDTQNILAKIFEDLKRLNQAKNSILILVHLPTAADYGRGSDSPWPWRTFLKDEAERQQIYFIDLIDDIRGLTFSEAQTLFILESPVNYPAAAGHYSQAGNVYIAQKLYDKLRDIPELSPLFSKK